MSEITKALVKFQRACPTIIKDRTGQEGNRTYKYADLAQIMNAVQPILSDNGLYLCQTFEPNGETYLVTKLMHESGESLESKIALPIQGLLPKQAGSAISYYRRYSTVAMLGIAADDDDGEAAQRAGATHGKPSYLTQQLQASIAVESRSDDKDGRKAVPDQYASDPAFAPFIKEIGGKKYWKTTAITGTNESSGMIRQFLHDLEGLTDVEELDGLEYDNRTLLQACQVALPVWWNGKPGSDVPGIKKRIEDKRSELSRIARDDPARYLNG